MVLSKRIQASWFTGGFLVAMLAFAVDWMEQAVAQDSVPSAEAILAKYINAVGGEEAFAKITNRVTKSKVNFGGVFEGTATSYVAPPGNNYVEIELGAAGKMTQGVKDGVAWDISPMAGARILDGREKAERLRGTQLDPYLNWKEDFAKAETAGEDKVGEVACYKVTLTPKEGQGSPITVFFDKDSGLALKTISKSPEGADVTTLVSDYKEVDGVKVAHKTTIEAAPLTVESTIESVSQNTELPADRFDLPDEIKKLMDAPKQ